MGGGPKERGTLRPRAFRSHAARGPQTRLLFEKRPYYAENSPFSLVDFLEKVKHHKDDGENFTEQPQTICFTTVLGWVFKSRAID